MKRSLFPVILLAAMLGACANPFNRATSETYADTCAMAESNGKYELAEQACSRALVNADWGNLGLELKSQRLYNLGHVKRRMATFADAEALYKESLQIEERLSGPSSSKIARRLVELAASLAGQEKWLDGTQALDRALPMTNQLSVQERTYMADVLRVYTTHLASSGDTAHAALFDTKAVALHE